MNRLQLSAVIKYTIGFIILLVVCTLLRVTQVSASQKITISSADELKKIGRDSSYPMSGDYVLGADIELSGEDWIPIGGMGTTGGYANYIGSKGSVNPSDPNVFSGTFDGAGHVISGLTINLSDTVPASGSRTYAQIGLFSVIASNSSDDYAIVKNIIFSKVDIHVDFDGGFSAIGTLAGEVNGYANVDGIAVIDGSIMTNSSKKSDTVGTGGIIGECRTNDSTIGNNNITLSNLYNAATIVASGSRDDLLYAGGIVGRIAKSSCKQIKQCLNVGSVQYDGYNGYAIAAAEVGNTSLLSTVSDCYCLNASADTYGSEAAIVSEASLRNGSLPSGLPVDIWQAKEGCLPAPKICYESSVAGYIYLDGLVLGFADGENAQGVKTEIDLPLTWNGHTFTWTSDNSVIQIIGSKAVASTDEIGDDVAVFITATSDNGYSKKFKVVVIPQQYMKAVFQSGYAKVGQPLKVVVNNPGTLTFNYHWTVNGSSVGSNSDTYIPSASDEEKLITVDVKASDGSKSWTLRMYVSSLPVVYIDTDDGNEVTSNSVAKGAYIKLQGNDEFHDSKTLYEGRTTIKGRGNSTWSYAVDNNIKKPYKLKLDSKSNLLGLGANGKNKHWVLLANMIDHTNMRNEIAHNFSRDIGMQYWMGSTNVVLVLNGEYQGVYQLCEHVRVGKSRVNVFDWEELADDIAAAICKVHVYINLDALETHMEQDFSFINTGYVEFNGQRYTVSDYYTGVIPDRTGGFLLDMDFRSNGYGKYKSNFTTSNTIPMFFRSPEYAKTNTELMQYTKDYVNAYEAAIKSEDFCTNYAGIKVHYSDVFDMDSLIQYWYVCELTNNWDSMKNSTYVYKDIAGKAYMGPAWDYDWGFANINMYYCDKVFVADNWHTTLTGIAPADGGFAEQEYQKQQWNRFLVKDPYFVTRVYEYYKKYRDTVFEDLIRTGGTVDTLYDKYAKASYANDEKWSWSYSKYKGKAWDAEGNVISWTNSQTYDDAVITLKQYLKKRIDWFDKQFSSIETLYKSLGNRVDSSISVQTSSNSVTGDEDVAVSVDNNSVKYVKLIVNGDSSDSEQYYPVNNGTAKVTLDYEKLITDGTMNTVVVTAYDSSKAYIDGAMNYANFKAEYIQTPSPAPTELPTVAPTAVPTATPTVAPTKAPTATPTVVPEQAPTIAPFTTPCPTEKPGSEPKPTVGPDKKPSDSNGVIQSPATNKSDISVTPSIKIAGSKTVKKNKKIILKIKLHNLNGKIKWSVDKKGKKLIRLNKKTGKKISIIAGAKKGKAIITAKCGKYKAVKKIIIK